MNLKLFLLINKIEKSVVETTHGTKWEKIALTVGNLLCDFHNDCVFLEWKIADLLK